MIRVSGIHKLWCWRCPNFLGRLLMEYSAENWIWWCGINIKDNIKKKNKEIWCLRRDIIIGAVGEKIDFRVATVAPPLWNKPHRYIQICSQICQISLSFIFCWQEFKKGWKIQPFLILCKYKIVFCEQNCVRTIFGQGSVVVSACYQCSK